MSSLVAVDFDPVVELAVEDPYPRLAALRSRGGVVPLRSGFWAVTDYASANEALRHRACVSGPIATGYRERLPLGAARDEMGNRINFLDPPDHTRVRALVSRAFTPRRIERLIPWIATTAAELIAGLGGVGAFDLLHGFAHQVPSLVISELLGVPAADRDQLTTWSDEVAPLLGLSLTADVRERAVAASERFHAYIGALLDERRREPGDDLLSALVLAEEGGERLSRTELLSLVATLYSAGHRTTRDLFTNGMSVLLRHPELYRRVVAGEWGTADVVEEFLRFETPTLFVARYTSGPVRLGDVVVPAEAPVLVFLAGANRDPAAYEEPDVFRPGKSGPAALSFAFGAHYCLGAALARAEAEAMLRAVVEFWPDLQMADDSALAWQQRGPFRGLRSLRVQVGRTR